MKDAMAGNLRTSVKDMCVIMSKHMTDMEKLININYVNNVNQKAILKEGGC